MLRRRYGNQPASFCHYVPRGWCGFATACDHAPSQTGIVRAMQRSLVLMACLLAIAAAVSTWFWWPRSVAPPRYDDPGSQIESGYPQANSGDITRIPLRSNGLKTRSGQNRILSVQLRGIHQDVPWTNDLRLEMKDRSRRFDEHHCDAPVTATGKCILKLPEWWQSGMPVKLSISGRNEHYRELVHRERGTLALENVLKIEVQPVAALNGKVTDSRGKAIASARISAFAMRAGQPTGELLGATGTDHHGNYHLRAPPDMRLLIVVTAMTPNVMMWRTMDGVNDSGNFRGDLLPTTRPVQLAINHPGTACDFTLADADSIDGTVLWPDRTPAVGAQLRFVLGDGIKLALSKHAEVMWQQSGSVVANGIAEIDDKGRFSVPTAPSAAATLTVIAVGKTRIIGKLPTQHVGAPATTEIMLPFPVTVRAVHDGQLVPHARVLIHGHSPHRAEADGTSSVLFATDAMARAEQGPLRSPWQSLASSHLEQTIDMVMRNQLVELQIEFDGKIRVRNAQFTWQCADGRKATETLSRGDSSGPFRMWLDPGDYELHVSAGRGERNGTFLLPIDRTFNTRTTNKLVLPARFGGTFALQVLDDRGRYVAGSCTVRGVDGKKRMVRMEVGGKPGVFGAKTARCTDILAPGPYELLIDIDGFAQHKRYVQIKMFEVAPVVVRL